MAELMKTCPFCQSPARVLAHIKPGYRGGYVWAQVDCRGCRARGPYSEQRFTDELRAEAREQVKAAAVRGWNERG